MFCPRPRICDIDWNTICRFDPIKLELMAYVGISIVLRYVPNEKYGLVPKLFTYLRKLESKELLKSKQSEICSMLHSLGRQI